MVETEALTTTSHRRLALRLAERAADLTAHETISKLDIELLQLDLDELSGWVSPEERSDASD